MSHISQMGHINHTGHIQNRCTVRCPATIANLVCGFDILGLALYEPYDIIHLSVSEAPGVRISHNDNFHLPTDPDKNIVGVVLQAILKKTARKIGFDIQVEKRIRPGSGLGSSAASAAGAAVAANYLLGTIFPANEIVEFAMIGEQLASAARHADNIAPSIFGGVNLVRSLDPLDIVQLPTPDLFVTVIQPQIEVKTSEARQILPEKIFFRDATRQWANIAGLVTGFFKNDYELISRSLEDVIVEPYRSNLIPGFHDVKRLSKEAGALGGGISGSGPSIFMLSESESIGKTVETLMSEVYNKIGIDYNTYVTKINPKGVEVASVDLK